MLKWSKISNELLGKVDIIEGIDESGLEDYAIEQGYIQRDVSLGYDMQWYLTNMLPHKDINVAKEEKKTEINFSREKALLTEGAEFDNDLFDVDSKSQINIMGLVVIASKSEDGKVFVYRSKTNKNHLFNAEQLANCGSSISQKIEQIYQKSWILKESVDSCKTLEEVESIVWN